MTLRDTIDVKPLLLTLPHNRIQARALPPEVRGRPAETAPLQWTRRNTEAAEVGGVAGGVERFEAPAVIGLVTLDVFRSDGPAAHEPLIAVRMSVRNDGPDPVELTSLTPLWVDGDAGAELAAGQFADWRVVRAGRQKNDVPGNFRFTDDDIDLQHARIDAAEFKAGSGVQASDLAKGRSPSTSINADPYLWIKNRHDESSTAFFIGVLGQTEHLTRINLACNEARDEFRSLSTICEMDGVVVQPGESRTTHWVVIYESADEETLRQRHVDLFAAVANVPKPTTPPVSYFCSWYFYGCDFTQADLDENLTGLKERPIPFDVLLIDNGWMTDFGTYDANERFPLGMAHAARAIKEAGYRPGIWTCPFVIMKDSPALQKYPNLIARDDAGNAILFPYEQTKEYVVDPTSPDAEAYFTELFTKLRDWGFEAHKFDFLRAITSNARIRFHDRSMNRAQAYRHAMAMFRRLAGDEAYILACGGLFEASAGLVDGMRIGSDTKGRWSDPNGATAYQRMGYVVRVKQNVFRNHTNRLWHTDPDALQLRVRHEPFRNRPEYFHLCQGSFTDEEATTIVAHQYLGGGIVCLCERMVELSDDRLLLLRKALPTVTPPANIVDFGAFECPTTFWTAVTPQWDARQQWATLVVCNWSEAPIERTIRIDAVPQFASESRVAAMELTIQQFLGVRSADDAVVLTIPSHGTRVLRLAAWNGQAPLLLGTDGHLSGGAAEFTKLRITNDSIQGEIGWKWNVPITVTIGIPNGSALSPCRVTIPATDRRFSLAIPPLRVNAAAIMAAQNIAP